MPEFATTIARNEHECPRCGAARGEHCRTPGGRHKNSPHGERVSLLSPSDWDRCKGKALSAADLLGMPPIGGTP